MFVHTVYFWLKKDLSPRDLTKYLQGLKNLTEIPSVEYGFYGVPAPTDRPVIDRSYSYGLTIVCRDLGAHDAYQADPAHEAFRTECAHCWDKVLIYDYV